MWIGVVLALITSMSWALGNVFIQKSGKAVGAPRAMLWAMLAGGVLSGVLSALLDTRAGAIDTAVVGWIALAGASGLVAYLGLFRAFERAPLSIAVPLVSSWSVVAGLFALLVLHERPTGTQLVGGLVVVLGVVLVSVAGAKPQAGQDRAGWHGLWPSFAAAIGFGIMVPVMTARVAPAVGAFGATSVVYAVGVALALPLGAVLRVPLRPPPRGLWAVVLVTGCFETVGFVCIAFAHRFAPTAVVTPVSSLAAAFTVLYAWVVLRERPHPMATAGAVLASVGIVVLSS